MLGVYSKDNTSSALGQEVSAEKREELMWEILAVRDRVRAFILRKTRGNKALTEDIVQQAYENAFVNLGSFKGGDAKVFTWMCAIAQNVFVDIIRTETRRKDLLDNHTRKVFFDEAIVDSPEDILRREETRRKVQWAVEELARESPEQAEVVKLLLEGVDQKDIPERLNIPIGTAKSQLFRAKKKLVEILARARLGKLEK